MNPDCCIALAQLPGVILRANIVSSSKVSQRALLLRRMAKHELATELPTWLAFDHKTAIAGGTGRPQLQACH
jgi:hypothetical protein